jgi:hypothetical protein
MADELTPRLHLIKPDVGASDDTWGDKLNQNFDILDTFVPLDPNAVPSNTNPLMDGTVNPGLSLTYSRGDHIHPSDTTKSNVGHGHASTEITDFAEAVDDRTAALLVAGTNIALTYDDVGNKLTITSTVPTSVAPVIISDTPPASPVAGMIWWESDTGLLYVYYNDGNTSQWVTPNALIGPTGAPGPQGPQGILGPVGPTGASGTVPKKNYLINGAMMVSQQNGAVAGTIDSYYPVDQWFTLLSLSGGVVSTAQVAKKTPAGSPNRIRSTVTTAQPTIGGSYLIIASVLEGIRVADLMLGTPTAKSFTVQLGVNGPAGTYPLIAFDSAGAVAQSSSIVISAGEANTDVVKSVTFNAFTGGTFNVNNTVGLSIRLYLAAAGSANLLATNGNIFELFDVSLTDGVPSPFVVPHYNDELLACQRYWQTTYVSLEWTYASAGQCSVAVTFKPQLCKAPVITFGTPEYNANNTGIATVGTIDAYHAWIQSTSTAGVRAYWYGAVFANARL